MDSNGAEGIKLLINFLKGKNPIFYVFFVLFYMFILVFVLLYRRTGYNRISWKINANKSFYYSFGYNIYKYFHF